MSTCSAAPKRYSHGQRLDQRRRGRFGKRQIDDLARQPTLRAHKSAARAVPGARRVTRSAPDSAATRTRLREMARNAQARARDMGKSLTRLDCQAQQYRQVG